MNYETIRSDIEAFTAAHADAIQRDIARLIAINSVEGTPAPGAPFGPGPRAALDTGLQIARQLGLETVDYDGLIGYAALGQGDRYLATITHLDVVPAGDGWESDPFTLREREGYLIGRGVLDDKGPSVLCLYALKYLKDRAIPLRYPIRAILGVNEETDMRDVDAYLEHFPAPLFCFSPDADFPLCNGEKGIYVGRITAAFPAEDILSIHGGVAHNVIPDKAEAVVRAQALRPAERVAAEEIAPGQWKLTATGVGGHASQPEDTCNAIGVLVQYLLDNHIGSAQETRFLELLSALHNAWDGSGLGVAASDALFTPLTIVGGVIGMENGRIYQILDSRYPTSTSAETITAAIQARAGALASVTTEQDAQPFYASLDDPAVEACVSAYNAVTGEDAKPYTIGGGTYARHFPNAVSFGPEHPERPQPDWAGPIHGANEAASKADLLEALKIYIFALLTLEELEL